MHAIAPFIGVILVQWCGHSEAETVGRCQVPEPPLFGSITVNRKEQWIQYSCDSGFTITARRPRQCVQTGKKKGLGSRHYIWTGQEPFCVSDKLRLANKGCRKIEHPQHGKVSVMNYTVGGIANFECDSGYKLDGASTLRCMDNHQWNTEYPTCYSTEFKDIVQRLQDKFIDKYAMGIAGSTGGLQAKLGVGGAGLELIFALDTSSSIGPTSLGHAKEFVRILCKRFNISDDPMGGNMDTRISIVTFSDNVNILFNLNDRRVRSLEKVYEKIDGIRASGGGTNLFRLMAKIKSNIILRNFGPKKILFDARAQKRKENANKALFLITDAENAFEDTKNKAKTERWLKVITDSIKTEDGFEVFAIGIGSQFIGKESKLVELASPPFFEHVFHLQNHSELERAADIISERNIDYGMCGISGNTAPADQDGNSFPGAWPWLGWFSSLHNSSKDEKIILCGGALLCDKWFITLASCVTNTGNGTDTVSESRINLFLGDHYNFHSERSELMAQVERVYVHPNYTGIPTKHGVIPYDVALLELGHDNETTPELNKRVRPICFPESIGASILMSSYKQFNDDNDKKVTLAGWGNNGKQKIPSGKVHPWMNLMQMSQPLQSNHICGRRYPGLDTAMFLCAGEVHGFSLEPCYGDIGGPLMVLTDEERYTFFGLALRTNKCKDRDYHFSIFLNVLQPEIHRWVQEHLQGCNRVKML